MINIKTRNTGSAVTPFSSELNDSKGQTVRTKVLFITSGSDALEELCIELASRGYGSSVVPYGKGAIEAIEEYQPDLLLTDIEFSSPDAGEYGFVRMLKSEVGLPVIALITEDTLTEFDVTRGIEDFLLKPCDPVELAMRIKQVLWRIRDIDSDSLIKHGDLVIDLAKYEVSVAGKTVNLSFREYELLRFLASSKGIAFTRDTLLNEIWGYDYFGGDRTVDVHIRRLRSKIEDAGHSFIETVRSVGYKFKV